MITRKAGPALAAGCTMVIKPANETPFTALAMAELANQAGIRRGVINVVTGQSREIGAVFTGDERVRKLSLYRFDRSWPRADAPVRGIHQKALFRARR